MPADRDARVRRIAESLLLELGPRGAEPANRDLPLAEAVEGWLSFASTIVDDFDELMDGYELPRREEVERGRQALQLLSDLDRCQHGRHERDGCYGCETDTQGALSNAGNAFLDTGYQLGSDISGRPLIVPEPGRRHDPAAWYRRS